MKGILFTEFQELIETAFGLDVLDQVLEKAEPKLSTGGAYTSVGTYPHTELLTLLDALVSLVDAPLGDMLQAYAHRLIASFESSYPDFFSAHDELFSFLLNVEGQMHAGVRKLYPEANPPTLEVEAMTGEMLKLNYNSHRPLSVVVEPLVQAAADRYNCPIQIEVLSVSEDGTSSEVEIRKVS